MYKLICPGIFIILSLFFVISTTFNNQVSWKSINISVAFWEKKPNGWRMVEESHFNQNHTWNLRQCFVGKIHLLCHTWHSQSSITAGSKTIVCHDHGQHWKKRAALIRRIFPSDIEYHQDFYRIKPFDLKHLFTWHLLITVHGKVFFSLNIRFLMTINWHC